MLNPAALPLAAPHSLPDLQGATERPGYPDAPSAHIHQATSRGSRSSSTTWPRSGCGGSSPAEPGSNRSSLSTKPFPRSSSRLQLALGGRASSTPIPPAPPGRLAKVYPRAGASAIPPRRRPTVSPDQPRHETRREPSTPPPPAPRPPPDARLPGPHHYSKLVQETLDELVTVGPGANTTAHSSPSAGPRPSDASVSQIYAATDPSPATTHDRVGHGAAKRGGGDRKIY
jgi:hypothetical protein